MQRAHCVYRAGVDLGRRIAGFPSGRLALLDRLQIPRLQFPHRRCSMCWKRRNIGFARRTTRTSILEVPLNDEATFRLLGLGLTNSILRFTAITAKSLLRTHRPESIAQLMRIHANAGKRHPSGGDPNPVDSLPECILSYWCAYLKVHHPVLS